MRVMLNKAITAIRDMRGYAVRIPLGSPGRDLIIVKANSVLHELGIERLDEKHIEAGP